MQRRTYIQNVQGSRHSAGSASRRCDRRHESCSHRGRDFGSQEQVNDSHIKRRQVHAQSSLDPTVSVFCGPLLHAPPVLEMC